MSAIPAGKTRERSRTEIPMLIGGEWRAASEMYEVRDPYRGDIVELAYGGVKESGIGREGPRYSIRDMTEERVVLFNY